MPSVALMATLIKTFKNFTHSCIYCSTDNYDCTFNVIVVAVSNYLVSICCLWFSIYHYGPFTCLVQLRCVMLSANCLRCTTRYPVSVVCIPYTFNLTHCLFHLYMVVLKLILCYLRSIHFVLSYCTLFFCLLLHPHATCMFLY